jgi:hypothetical protein
VFNKALIHNTNDEHSREQGAENPISEIAPKGTKCKNIAAYENQNSVKK